jgi:hypothetical protein
MLRPIEPAGFRSVESRRSFSITFANVGGGANENALRVRIATSTTPYAGVTVTTPAGLLTAGAVHHFYVQWDGTTIKLFIDGGATSNRNTDPQFASSRFRDGGVHEALADQRELEFTHRPLQPQQQTIIRQPWIVDTIRIDHVRADEAAELEQVMPIASVAREARSFQAEHRADCTFADAADEIAEAGTIHCAACRAAEIRVDHCNVMEAIAAREIDKLVLSSLALDVLVHLRSCRLTDVDDGPALQYFLRQFTERHREPRRRRVARPPGAGVREERRPPRASSVRAASP